MPATNKTAKGKGRKPAAKSPILDAIESFGDPRELAKSAVTGKVAAGATYTISRPFAGAEIGAADVAQIRAAMGMSQAAFSAFLNVSVQTVQAWEQGRNPVTGIAAKFLTVIRDDIAYWKTRATSTTG